MIQTRSEQLRRYYAEQLTAAITAHKRTVIDPDQALPEGLEEGQAIAPADVGVGLVIIPAGPFVARLLEIFDGQHDDELPEIDEQAAEVRTPARITVDARCPACGETSTGSLFVSASLTVEASGKRELKLKGKTEPIAHSCGQRHTRDVTPTDVVEGQLAIDELVGARCVAITGGEEGSEIVCGHVDDEHVAEGEGPKAADGSELRPCKVAGCECDDLRLADVEPSFLADLPEGELDTDARPEEAIEQTPAELTQAELDRLRKVRDERGPDVETPAPTGDDVAVGDGAPADQVDACPWPGCIKGANHGGRHSKGGGK